MLKPNGMFLFFSFSKSNHFFPSMCENHDEKQKLQHESWDVQEVRTLDLDFMTSIFMCRYVKRLNSNFVLENDNDGGDGSSSKKNSKMKRNKR